MPNLHLSVVRVAVSPSANLYIVSFKGSRLQVESAEAGVEAAVESIQWCKGYKMSEQKLWNGLRVSPAKWSLTVNHSTITEM